MTLTFQSHDVIGHVTIWFSP